MNTPRVRPILLLLIASAMHQGCRRQGPLEVAAVLPLSGPNAVYGTSLRDGAVLAAEELEGHATPGAPAVKLSIADSAGAPHRAAELLARAFRAGADAAVGGVGGAETAALAEVASLSRRVLLSPASSTPARADSPYVFHLYPSVASEAGRMGQFAARELALRRVVVVRPFGQPAAEAVEALQRALESQGGLVAGTVEHRSRLLVTRTVEQVEALRPQAVYLIGPAPLMEPVVEGLRQRRYRGAILTTSSFAVPAVLAAAGPSAEGLLVSRTPFDTGSGVPKTARFAERFRDRFQREPDVFAAYGYDAVQVLAAAHRASGGHPRQLWKGMLQLREHPGVTGAIQFDERGAAPSFPRVYVVIDGHLSEVGSLSDAARKRLARMVAWLPPGAGRLRELRAG